MTDTTTPTIAARFGQRTQRIDTGWAALIVAVTVLSLGSTLSRKVDAPGVSLACVRSFLGSAMWMVILGLRGRHVTWQGFKAAALPGICFGINIGFFFTAAQHTRIANVEFIGALGPLVIVPAGAVVFHERIPWKALACALPALGGVALVALESPSTPGVSNAFGLTMAVCSVFAWAAYLLSAKKFRPRIPLGEFMAIASAMSGVVLTPMALHQGVLHDIPAHGWPWLVLLTVNNGVVAHTLILAAQRSVSLGTISTMQVAQPALASAAAWILLGQQVRPVQFIGMAIVMAALVAYSITVGRGVFPWQRQRR
jgi:drug/metabolite transporter (DMT)-like permease